ILTFASIRTDLELNEIKRQTITICLRKDIVPSTQAFLTHGLTFDELSLGINEYKAAIEIHKILNTPNTISLGYNSLGFDDDFLRFMFYRNLLDPYSHQYANGCSRMDIMPITILFRVFHPAILNWPQIDGKPSLKLDLISRENNFVTTGRAHEALNDVEAVIELSKKMFQQKDIWNYCLDFFNKTRDEVRINNIDKKLDIQNTRFRICLMVSASFGSKVNYMAPVIHIGESLPYKNQSLWLRLDSDDILGLNTDLDIKDTFVIRKRPADALIVLPALERFLDKLPEESRNTARENMEKLSIHKERFFEFIQYHIGYKYPFIPNMDPDAALYQDGFFSFQEKKEINLFHQSLKDLNLALTDLNLDKTESIKKIKSTIKSTIKSPRIKILANRILARNFDNIPDNIPDNIIGHAEDTEYRLYMKRLKSSLEKDQIIGYKNDIKLNCRQGLEELKTTQQALLNPDQDTKRMLGWLKKYIKTL
ncbi:MAG: exodeoxyribonuclease I, partial [Proteobacteria bacterium]|nr:exodeoxyribonuclease I [Pseudomonadota bacterium]